MKALLSHPALWLTLTLGIYLGAMNLHKRAGYSAWTNPLLLSTIVLISALLAAGTSYTRYMDGARVIHFMLTPATVALAVPLYTNLSHIRSMFRPLMIALAVGGTTGIVSALLFGRLFGLPREVLVSFAPKSVTTPIAMALSTQLGGSASLTAAAVLLTGIGGAMAADGLLRSLGVHNGSVRGFAIGLASHGIGTTRAFHISQKAGAFSSLGMSLNGVFTSLFLPILLSIWPL